MVVHVAADILKLDPDGKVADKLAEDTDEISMGLVLRQLPLGIVPMRNDTIAVSPDSSCNLRVQISEYLDGGGSRQNGMQDRKNANSSKKLTTIIVRHRL